MTTVTNEPVLAGTAITGVVTASFTLATAFGVDLTQIQQTAILGLVTALTIIVGVWQRSRVTPTSTAHEAVKVALQETPQPMTGIERQASEILAGAKS